MVSNCCTQLEIKRFWNGVGRYIQVARIGLWKTGQIKRFLLSSLVCVSHSSAAHESILKKY